uniref:Plasma membrane ATPase (EC) n=1 Tax=Ganoderma boninense TaxID=34458 RepID=A0A5K1JRR2_9APHY|nr:Plasma membrane ATPase (EC [Ganoderma boninense]
MRARDGGDIHVAIDATFSQRHNVAAGEGHWFHEPKYFLPKEQVDAMGAHINAARKKSPRSHKSKVPESALDECERSYEAANEKKDKTQSVKFDDTGLMALVCRHDIVLFLANVDTPGEQQKYGVALIAHLFSHLPERATVVVYYDIGCVLDRSLHQFDILPDGIMQRLLFATSVMHAYGHQWACQLVYNPRLQEGLGLTEGEGTERIWSKFRMLIARERAAIEELSNIKMSVSELREQWSLQRAAQLSVKNQLDAMDRHFSHVHKVLGQDASNPEAYHFLESLQRTHANSISKVEKLYASLNVTDSFPEIQGLPLEFVRTLLMARDLKINIRKRAIGTFFEWDKLDRAAGGRDQPLGTKLHQQARKAISKRTPALLTAIRKFNKYCDDLQQQYKTEWNFPLPAPLPGELGPLREDASLLADVWVTRLPTATLKWLEDPQTQTSEATRLAVKYSGGAEPVSLHWVHVNVPQPTEDQDFEDDVTAADDQACLLYDTVENIVEQVDSDLSLIISPPSHQLMIERDLWIYDTNPYTIRSDTSVMTALPPFPTHILESTSVILPESIPAVDGHSSIFLSSPALARFRQPNGWLNDDSINIAAQVFLRHTGSSAHRDPAIFSTFVLPMQKKGDEALWRLCKPMSEFWKKDIWIFPLHRNGDHWTLAVVYWKKRRIAYFDSFGSKSAFKTDVPAVFTLIHQLQRIAAEHENETCSIEGDWKAYPLVDVPLQDNGYDCGVWILACLAAVLRGFTSTGLSSSEVPELRRRILGMIYTAADV